MVYTARATLEMPNNDFNTFATVIGVIGSLISVLGLLTFLFREAHLPKARLNVLYSLVMEMDTEVCSAFDHRFEQLSGSYATTWTDRLKAGTNSVCWKLEGYMAQSRASAGKVYQWIAYYRGLSRHIDEEIEMCHRIRLRTIRWKVSAV
jgi:hypothetical protein